MRTVVPINMEVTHFEKKIGTTLKLIPPFLCGKNDRKRNKEKVCKARKHQVSF